MFTNEIDRCECGIDVKCDIISKDTKELNIKGCIAFSLSQKGNVPVVINGTIRLDANCATRSFPSYLGLEYVRDWDIKWLSNGIADPNPQIEIVRVYIKQKEK